MCVCARALCCVASVLDCDCDGDSWMNPGLGESCFAWMNPGEIKSLVDSLDVATSWRFSRRRLSCRHNRARTTWQSHTLAFFTGNDKSVVRSATAIDFVVVQILAAVIGAVTALRVLDKEMLALGHDAGILESLALIAAHHVLPAGQGRSVVDLEAEDLWFIAAARFRGHQSRVDLEEDVVEGAAKVGAVDTGVARRLGVVDVLALGAVEFHGLQSGVVAGAEGQERVRFAHDAWAAAKVGLLELLDHLGHAARGDDVARVHEAVQVAGGLLNRLAHVVFAVQVEHVRDQVQRMLVVVHLRVKAGQVEAVGDVVLVDFAKVLIAAG